MKKAETDWKKKLTPLQYNILREKGTEAPFCGAFFNHKEKGEYHCAACNSNLFSSKEKYDSKTGWPSFFEAENVEVKKDFSDFMVRDEVVCRKCKGHLGHVFNDGPPPTGLRYCINSAALVFKGEKK